MCNSVPPTESGREANQIDEATQDVKLQYTNIYNSIRYGTVSAKIAYPRLIYKNASRSNRYNVPKDNAIDFLFSTLHTTPFHYEVLKIGSR